MWRETRYALVALLVLTATLSLMPGTAEAETYGDFEYEVKSDGTVEITEYTGSEASVVVPDKIDNKSVTSMGPLAFYHCTSLTSVTIPDGVTSIGVEAFYGCSSLESMIFYGDAPTVGANWI
jgi:hypothetical protein